MSDRLWPFLLAVLAFSLACQVESGDDDDAGTPAELGDQLWERSLAANGIALAAVRNGSVAVVGNEAGGLWLGRFSAEGEPLWSRTEPGVLALAVAADAQRIIYAAGALGLESPSGGRITAYNLDGEHLWSLDDPARTPRTLASAPGGGVFAVGPAGAGEAGIFIERVLPSGDVQWSLTEADVAGEWLDADTWTDDMLLITGYREDGSWWVQARTALGDKLWTAELGEVIGPGFPSLAHGVRIHASILAQGEGHRGLVAAVSPWSGSVEWIQPLEQPPTDLAVGDGGSILLAGLVSPSITALGSGGATEWSIEPDDACPKTYGVARRSPTDAVLLRWCAGGGSQLALVQTQ